MERIDYIDHPATVARIDAAAGMVYLHIDREDECGTCPAAALCKVSGNAETIALHDPDPRRFAIGQKVTVRGSERLHRRAVMLATVIPCLLLIGVMTGVYLASGSQGWACISGLGAMTVFFVILYMLRYRMRSEFNFVIRARS